MTNGSHRRFVTPAFVTRHLSFVIRFVPVHNACTAMALPTDQLRACPSCGLTQRLPAVASHIAGTSDKTPRRLRACCARCGATLRSQGDFARHDALTASLALAALILYPVAITLPILKVRQLGNDNTSSIIDGVITLLADGEIFVGVVVLCCSILIPLGKLFALLFMSLAGDRLAHSHRALTHRIIDFTGRWGMLDVLAVAVLVAALKLGNMMDVTPGPAAFTFALCVVLSLLATASFDPHSIWDRQSVSDTFSGRAAA